MGREDWQGKDYRERTPFTYLQENGAWFQTQQYFKLYSGDSPENLAPALLDESPDLKLFLFIFGQDYLINGWSHQEFAGDAELNAAAPPSILLPQPDHWNPILPDNAVSLYTYLTATRVNWGHLEAVRAVTNTNGVNVVGWPARVNLRLRNYKDDQGDNVQFFIDGFLELAGDVKAGRPYNEGAIAVGEEAAVGSWWPAIIPEAAYTPAMQAANNWTTDVGGNNVYIVGLWQGTLNGIE